MSNVVDMFSNSRKDVPEIRYVLPGSKEEILMVPFTTKEQKALLKAIEKEDQYLIQEALDQILRNCVVTPNFNPDKLLSRDRECLLIELSKNTVVDVVEHKWTCDNEKCGHVNNLVINLNTLKYEEPNVKSINSKVIELEGFEVNGEKLKVKLSNLTRYEEKKIFQTGKKGGEEGSLSQADLVDATFASVIRYVEETKKEQVANEDGVVKDVERKVFREIKFDERLKIYSMFGLEDKKQIEEFFNELEEYGYDLVVDKEAKCDKCDSKKEVKLDWVDFFIV
jgi:hypothetical protein